MLFIWYIMFCTIVGYISTQIDLVFDMLTKTLEQRTKDNGFGCLNNCLGGNGFSQLLLESGRMQNNSIPGWSLLSSNFLFPSY